MNNAILIAIIIILCFFVCFSYYLLIGRTNKLISLLDSVFQLSERNFDVSVKNYSSKYLNSMDSRIIVRYKKSKSSVILLNATVHGQMKNDYILLIIFHVDEKMDGVYGNGRVARVLRRTKVNVNFFTKVEFLYDFIPKDIVEKAETIEAVDKSLYLYFSLGSIKNNDAIYNLKNWQEKYPNIF